GGSAVPGCGAVALPSSRGDVLAGQEHTRLVGDLSIRHGWWHREIECPGQHVALVPPQPGMQRLDAKLRFRESAQLVTYGLRKAAAQPTRQVFLGEQACARWHALRYISSSPPGRGKVVGHEVAIGVEDQQLDCAQTMVVLGECRL